MSKKEISFKGKIRQEQAIDYLESLLQAMREGTIYVQNGDDFVSLEPTDIVELEVSAARKKEKGKLELELSWSKEQPIEGESPLKILTSEPEISAAVGEDEEEEEEEEPAQTGE